MNELSLTPVMEDFNELRLGSSSKKVKDDFDLDQRSDDLDHGPEL